MIYAIYFTFFLYFFKFIYILRNWKKLWFFFIFIMHILAIRIYFSYNKLAGRRRINYSFKLI